MRQQRRAGSQDERRYQQTQQKAETPPLFASRVADHIAENSADAGDAAVEQQQRRGTRADEHAAGDGAQNFR